jgi:hypothetical protein
LTTDRPSIRFIQSSKFELEPLAEAEQAHRYIKDRKAFWMRRVLLEP